MAPCGGVGSGYPACFRVAREDDDVRIEPAISAAAARRGLPEVRGGKACAMTMAASRDLGFFLREQSARFGAHPAVIGGGETIGYDQLAERCARIASFLAARGIRRGDRIGLLMNNRPEWVQTFFGAVMAGAAVVAFSTWSKREELAYLIADSGIRLIVTVD